MPRHPPERRGIVLKVRERPVTFSFWPMARDTRRFALQSRIFASDPFNVIERAVNTLCPEPARPSALAYLEQSRDFFRASQAGGVRAAKPLLIYYCFMNLVKAYALTKGLVAAFQDHHHGLTTDFATGPGPSGVKLTAFPSTATKTNLFDLLLKGVTGAGLPNKATYDLAHVLPQILLGHRLWCNASDEVERFIEIERLDFRVSTRRKECWVRFDLLKTEYARLGYTQAKLIAGGHLGTHWKVVAPRSSERERSVRFEMISAEPFTHRPSDVLNVAVNRIRHSFWRSVTIVHPFRKYYVYVAAPNDPVLPQICSMYMILFYLASITRYRPEQFDALVSGPFGAFVQEFIENQPNQWLYMIASEFGAQEVTRAAVV